MMNSNEEADLEGAKRYFTTVIPESQFINAYQLHQVINHLGSMYGFNASQSGMKIYCACGRNHKTVQCQKVTFCTRFCCAVRK